jgi:hypothetical protein
LDECKVITAGSLVRFATNKSSIRILFILKDIEPYYIVVDAIASGDYYVHFNASNCLPRNDYGYWSSHKYEVIYDSKES